MVNLSFQEYIKSKSLQIIQFAGFDTIYAESGGFEPADPLTSQQFSRLPQSTTLPTLRDKSTNLTKFSKLYTRNKFNYKLPVCISRL